LVTRGEEARKETMGGTKWRKDGFSVARREVYCTGSNLVGGSEKFSVFAHFGRVTCLAPDQRHPVIVTPSPKMWNIGKIAKVVSWKLAKAR